MAEFTNLKLTKYGKEYLGRSLVEPINFATTIIKLSTQVVDPVDIPKLTTLNTITDIDTITQSDLNQSTNALVISARFNNLNIMSDIIINTIGLFVSSNGVEKLIAVTTATEPLIVRKINQTAKFYNLKLSLNISSNSNTPITITDGNLASIDDISQLDNEKANKRQEDWITPTLFNGWTDFGGVYESIGYMKDEFGFVHIKGMVKEGSVGAVLFKLPEGYRPLKHQYHPCFSLDVLRTLTIRGNGDIFIPAAASNIWLALNGISFKAEA